MWKALRIFILLLILVKAIQMTVLEEAKLDWKKSFYVAVYPINADGSNKVNAYIKTLEKENFEEVADYFAAQGERYNLSIHRPFEMMFGQEIKEIPPTPPVRGNMLDIIFWSLRFRYYAWSQSISTPVKPDIQIYLLYFDPQANPVLSHSTALNKGRIGRVNLFGDQSYSQQNLVILAHELLHTVKATDKYSLENNFPQYPDGYVESEKKPLYPQQFAELMAGRVPINKSLAVIPRKLQQTKIGEKTAKEIGWLK